MSKYITVIVIGLCLVGMGETGFAALDWHIRWDEVNAPNRAKVYIFNPENTQQTFGIEIGDVARTTDDDPYAPYLYIGQNKKVVLSPSERKIFDIIVYQDMDSRQTLTMSTDSQASSSIFQQHEQELRILGEKYGEPKPRQYPVATLGIEPVVREEPNANRATYKSKRGYWLMTLIDHDHIVEQIIRTGDGMGATFESIQDVILYYTQGNIVLAGEALNVWERAFPELRYVGTTPGTGTGVDCVQFVTVVTTNLSYYSAMHTITIGDVLASNDPSLSPVVAAEDVNLSVPPNTQTSKRSLRVYLMGRTGAPNPDSEYVKVITHNSQMEQAIRIGRAENYHACAIQDVIWYLNQQVPAPTTGKGLWDRIGGTVVPPVTTPGRPSLCLGSPTVQPGRQAGGTTFQNLLVVVGAVVPFSSLFRRRRGGK